MATRIIKAACSRTAAIVMAAVAASATLTVHADDPQIRNWIGGEEDVANTAESPYTIQNLANWDGSGNIGYGCHNDLYLSVTERTYINSTQGDTDRQRFGDYFCPNSGEFVFTGSLWNLGLKAGNLADSTVMILKKGDWTFQSYGVQIGVAANSTVLFTNESGKVEVKAGSNHKIGSGAGSCAKVVNQTGDWTFNNNLILADSAGSTGIVENISGDWSIGTTLYIANNGYGEFIQYGGSLTGGGDMYICRESGSTGTLTIKGGTVTVPSGHAIYFRDGGSTKTASGTINLDGGTLVTPNIKRYTGVKVADLNFNGGTLKANAEGSLMSNYLTVNVNSGGGTIDCNGNAVTLDQPNGFYGTGSLTFTGGNTITLNCDDNNNVGGFTYVASNTTVRASQDRAGKMLAKGIALVGALELNTPYTILASKADSDDWSSLDRSKVTCPSASAFTAALGTDNKSITVTVTAFKPGYWTGAAGDNNLSTAGNWADTTVPTSGNATFECVFAATLTKGATFAPSSITFNEGCASVTIDGNFTSLTSVTNNSTANQTFAGFVDFGARDIDVAAASAALSGETVTGGCVVFKGGARGAKVANHSIVAGNYTLTTDDAFTDASSAEFTVNTDSSLSVKKTTDTKNLNIGEGATFNVETFPRSVSSSSVDNRLWYWNKGTYVVSNFTFTGSARFWLGGNWNKTTPNANAILKIGTLAINDRGSLALHGTGDSYGTTLTMYIGEGGVNIESGKTGYYTVVNSNHKTTMRPWNSDFTFGRGSNDDYDFLLGVDKGNGIVKFTLNTDDEAGVPRTVTMDARIKTDTNTWTIAVAGHGTNVVSSASPLMTGTYAVTNTATVKFTAGAGFANGTISLDGGTTLEYANSGNTLALPCSSLVLPSSGKATLRINGDRLRDGEHVLVSGVSAGAVSLLDVEPAASVLDGRRYEVTEKNGNLVLNIISSGMMIIFN